MATAFRRHNDLHDLSRQAMIELLDRRGIRDRCVLAAMTAVPRELFVSSADVADAYADHPLPIAGGQTISQPYVVALMIEALALQPDDRVLEIGTGSGYSAAVLSQLVTRVCSVERLPELVTSARERLATLGFDGIDVLSGDGSLGWPEHAPYQAIVVWASAAELPAALIDQLAIDGRLVMPIGQAGRQQLVLVTKRSANQCSITDLGAVTFVPLIGEQGWPEQ